MPRIARRGKVQVCRAVRLLEMREMLESGRHSTRDLAKRLHVSRRTIERDLADIQAEPAYWPVVRDDNGCYYLLGSD